jgi:hypothetical protein
MKIPWDNPWFLQFAAMLVLSLIGIYLPKDSPIGQLLRRMTTDWMGKNRAPGATPATPETEVSKSDEAGKS